MGKIVFWLVVIFLVLFVLRMINVSKLRKGGGAQAKGGKAAPEAMVRCAQCGVFLPRPEARETAGGYRCNDPACTARH